MENITASELGFVEFGIDVVMVEDEFLSEEYFEKIQRSGKLYLVGCRRE